MVERSAHILIVEDEADIREMIGLALMRANYTFDEAPDAEQAFPLLENTPPDLVLLDWMLPGLSGAEFAKQLKNDPQTRSVPIILLTARSDESDKVKLLELGADDYITKPFSTRELVARIGAVLRRSKQASTAEPIEFEGLQLDPNSHRVMVLQRFIDISPTEFRLLHFLMTHPERAFSRRRLLDHIWGDNVHVEERTVDVHVRRLRQVLEPSGHDRLIQTVRGVGYRFSTH